MPAPRILTPTPPEVTGSYGADCEEWIAENLGDRLRPWQRFALERALEHRADGSLRWPEVLLTVSRQSGKTILLRGLCGWRASSAELFGEPQKVLSCANLKDTALLPWRMVAARADKLGAVARYSTGSERIEWPGEYEPEGAWLVHAATKNAGIGHSCGLVVVDEAWSVERAIVEGSLVPSQLERLDPQLWLISTAGDGASDLFAEHRSLAIGQLGAPELADILIVEWSAPPDAEDDDRDAWRMASSHWNARRLERLESLYKRTSREDFRRQYLNQWVQGSAFAWVTDVAWGRGRDPDRPMPDGLGSVAIETHLAGEPYGWVHAGLERSSGEVIVRAGICASRRELWAALEAIGRQHRGVRLLYPDGFRHHVPQLAGVGERIKVAPADSFAHYAATLQAVRGGSLIHAGQSVLSEQVLDAVPYHVADRGAMLSSKASSGPIYLARAMVWAAGYELRPEQRHRPMIVGG